MTRFQKFTLILIFHMYRLTRQCCPSLLMNKWPNISLHFSNEYRQVRSKSGLGTRHAPCLKKTTTVSEILKWERSCFSQMDIQHKEELQTLPLMSVILKIPMNITFGIFFEQPSCKLLASFVAKTKNYKVLQY